MARDTDLLRQVRSSYCFAAESGSGIADYTEQSDDDGGFAFAGRPPCSCNFHTSSDGHDETKFCYIRWHHRNVYRDYHGHRANHRINQGDFHR